MNATAYFIRDRAQSLAYEALQFPTTAETALAWIHRAMARAKGEGLTDLEETLSAHINRIEVRAFRPPPTPMRRHQCTHPLNISTTPELARSATGFLQNHLAE